MRMLSLLALALAGIAPCAAAQSAPPIEIEQRLDFKPGTAKARAVLMRVAAVRDMVEDGFAVAMVDLNDDGRKEIIVQAQSSSFCGSGGCALVVLEQQGSKMKTLLTLNADSALGVTRQRFGAYRALAAIDQQGRVVIGNKPGAPLHGKPLVYPMAGAPLLAAVAPQAPSVSPSAPGKEQPAGIAIAMPAGAEKADIVGVRVGMPASEAQRVLKAHNPRLHFRTEDIAFKHVEVAAPFVLVANDNGPSAEEVVVGLSLPPHAGRVTEVLRYLSFHQSARPTVVSLVQTLSAKYGTRFESLQLSAVEKLFIWRLDGQPIDMKSGACSYRGAPVQPDRRWSAMKRVDDLLNELRYVKGPPRVAPPCGTLAVAYITVNHLENERIATSMLVRVSSESFRAQSLYRTVEYLDSLNERRKSKEAGAASGVKVKM